jgi:hypothetical protein
MNNWNSEPPLPEWIQDAYDDLDPLFNDRASIPRKEVEDFLLANSEMIEAEGDAALALKRLLNRGWVYEVGGEIRRTD